MTILPARSPGATTGPQLLDAVNALELAKQKLRLPACRVDAREMSCLHHRGRSIRDVAGPRLHPEDGGSAALEEGTRHATITELAENTGNLAAVAAVAGHKDLRTASRYFHAGTKAASEVLRARTAADAKLEIVTPIAEMKPQTVTVTVTGCRDGEGELGIPRLLQHGRVAQLDRALPSGDTEKARISCKKQGITSFDGSQKDVEKGTSTHDNWNGYSLDPRLMLLSAWGALRCV